MTVTLATFMRSVRMGEQSAAVVPPICEPAKVAIVIHRRYRCSAWRASAAHDEWRSLLPRAWRASAAHDEWRSLLPRACNRYPPYTLALPCGGNYRDVCREQIRHAP